MAYTNLRRYQPNTTRNDRTDCYSGDEVRLVLIGKTGNGKSASGNTILKRNAFKSMLSPASVTFECTKATGVVDGCRVAVIDTPGICDTNFTEDEAIQKVTACVSLSAPGPHVFLIVVKQGKFTEEEQKTVELLEQVFGSRAADYSMILFTQGDLLKNQTIEDYFSRSEELSYLISKCKWRYHVFNNTIACDSQLTGFFLKINRIISDNSGKFYTNAMFQEAERAIQEEQRKIQQEMAEQKRKEVEQLRAMLQGEELQERLRALNDKYEKSAREKAEKKNKFIRGGLVMATAEVGIAIGAAATIAGGPICIGIGAVVGGLVGAAVGAVTPVAGKALKKKKCSIQ